MDTNQKYKHAGTGGTFDRLHQGHKALIQTALLSSQKVTIGLTVDNFSNHKTLHQIIHSYDDRKKQLEEYLSEINQLNRVSITPLKDVYGPTISDPTIDCLVVTHQTYKGAKEINTKRNQLNLKELPIIKAELIKDEEDKYLSSTRIRLGIVNRIGEVYKKFIKSEISFNQNQKDSLKEPQGILVNDQKELQSIISDYLPTSIGLVGDITLSFFLKNNLLFNLGFYDGKTQRQPNHEVEELLSSAPQHFITNHPGTISPEISNTYESLSNNPNQIIKVNGEEDLLAVALVLLLPLQSVVIYGQPDRGLVVMKVSEDKKEQMKNLLNNK
jgi:cytidyltransferase-like protein